VSDRGHPLRFGVFITPSAGDADRVVALAELADRTGLDLVTFQDHPYQSRFLDTWTLLSFVAARTERVMLSPNVANLPLRPPAVLARSAASLDLLTGGRVELGLGAGAFWDAIEAMGGRRLTPGESVRALREAIDVIHAIWERGPKRVDGEFYGLHGARPGPRAAHDIGIWLGAYKPRKLQLTGAADIRRLANVAGPVTPATAPQWREQLTSLVAEYGFTTFIFAADDPTALEIIGQEIAPGVRDAVRTIRS
jgi:alkanesulfonate monooxygenase SsuD/methylene tetrahydromethanopterin reductase-like flavin-dependent oxidoreductase (luciferase family)